MTREVEQKPMRAVVAAVQLPDVSDLEFEASVIELRQLAKTLGFEVVHTFTQKRRRFDAGAYLGSGKREEMRRFVRNEPELDDVAGALPRRKTRTSTSPRATRAASTRPATAAPHPKRRAAGRRPSRRGPRRRKRPRLRPIRARAAPTSCSSTTRSRPRRAATSRRRSAAR